MLAIYKKEMKSYFTSMIGYVFVAFFLLVIGFYFMNYNLAGGYPSISYCLSSVTFLFLILAPIVTMRVMSEEKKQRTDQLLLTSPVSVGKIVVGKFFAVATLYLVVLAIVALFPVILSSYGTINFASDYTALLGFMLLGLALLSFGLFVSTCTENQIVSAVISFVCFLIMYFMTGLIGLIPADNKTALIVFSVLLVVICVVAYFMLHNITLPVIILVVFEALFVAAYKIKPELYDGLVRNVFSWLSPMDRFDTFVSGTIDLDSVVYFVSFTAIFLFLSCQSIKKRRWK